MCGEGGGFAGGLLPQKIFKFILGSRKCDFQRSAGHYSKSIRRKMHSCLFYASTHLQGVNNIFFFNFFSACPEGFRLGPDNKTCEGAIFSFLMYPLTILKQTNKRQEQKTSRTW